MKCKKTINPRLSISKSKKPQNPILNNFKPLKIDRVKKLDKPSLKKYGTCSNFNDLNSPFNFSMKLIKNSNSKNKKNKSSNISLRTSKTNPIKKKISCPNSHSKEKIKNKIKNRKETIKNGGDLILKMNLLKEEQIKMNILETSISIIKEKKENIKKEDKIPKKILSMKKIPQIKRKLNNNLNTNLNTYNKTNYSSCASNEKKNNLKKENDFDERQSEFLNFELGENISGFSIHNLNNENNNEEKEINLDELCSFYQRKRNLSLLDNNYPSEHSIYCFDINEMKDGENIHKVYNMALYINNYNSSHKELNNRKYDINKNNHNKNTISEVIFNYNCPYNGKGNLFRNRPLKTK